jgi:hypothetical protein
MFSRSRKKTKAEWEKQKSSLVLSAMLKYSTELTRNCEPVAFCRAAIDNKDREGETCISLSSGGLHIRTEKKCLLGFNAVKSVESHPTFRRNMSPPSSRSKNKLSSARCLLHSGFFQVLFRRKDESDMFLQNVVDFQRTSWHNIPEDITLRNHRCHGLKSHNSSFAPSGGGT